MNRAHVLFACLLVGCGQQQPPSVDALSANPARLRSLNGQCRAGQHDGAFCVQVAKADLRRFLSGKAGASEYLTLADLPPIPPSFDEPAEEPDQDGEVGQEDSP